MKEASGIRQLAESLSFEKDRKLFLLHAAVLKAGAAVWRGQLGPKMSTLLRHKTHLNAAWL
jgi:hypothetical protein